MPNIEILPTKKKLKYAGKYHTAGEQVNCPTQHARLLVAMGHAKYCSEEQPTTEQPFVQQGQPKQKKSKGKKSGNYQTRDMKADQE